MGVGNKMNEITDQMAVAIIIFGGFAIMALAAYLDDRKNRKWDEAWRAGYEQGQKVVKHHVR
jgi:hypothetical protein